MIIVTKPTKEELDKAKTLVDSDEVKKKMKEFIDKLKKTCGSDETQGDRQS